MSKLEHLIAELCPDGVEYRELGEVFKITRGRIMSKNYLRDNAGCYPVYSSQTSDQGIFGYINTFDYDSEAITWTTDGANAGSVFYHHNEKFSITNVCGLLKTKDNIVNVKFVFYVLDTIAKKYVSSGMGNPKLMSNAMAKISIPIPPLPVQQEIVRILDNFTELATDLATELTLRRKQYEFYRDKLLTFGEEVEWKPLGELCDILDSQRKPITKKDRKPGLYPYYGANGIQDYIDGYIFDGTFILMGEDGSVINENKKPILNWATGKIWVNNHAHVLSATPKAILRFVYHYLHTVDVSPIVRGMPPKINQKNLRKISIPIPPLEEQKRIVSILNRFDALVNDLTSGIPAEIEARRKQYEYYRDKLLTFKELAS